MILTRRKLIQVKLEAAKGTKETTGFTDILAADPEIQSTGPTERRPGGGEYMGNVQTATVGEQSGTCSLRAEMRGNGTLGLDAGVAALLQACGFGAPVTGVYKPASDPANQKTCTLQVWEEGVKKILYGAMGNLRLEGEMGKPLWANCEFQGIYEPPGDVARPTPSFGTETPPVLKGCTFTIGGASRNVTSFSLDMQNEIALLTSIVPATGIAYAQKRDRDPVVSFDLEAEAVGGGGYDVFGAWLAGTEAALSLVMGSGAGKQITISIPKLQYRDIPEGDRDGFQTWNIAGQCNHNTGDDDVSITVAQV